MRITFDELFDVDPAGNCKAKRAYNLSIGGNTFGGDAGGSMAFGLITVNGFRVAEMVGKDLEIDDRNGVCHVVGFYPTSGPHMKPIP